MESVRLELKPALDLARTLAPAELPGLLGDLEEIRVTALARITAPAGEARPDELLDVEQVAKRLHVSRHYLYRHHRKFPFARRVGRKLLFSAAGLDLYLKRAR